MSSELDRVLAAELDRVASHLARLQHTSQPPDPVNASTDALATLAHLEARLAAVDARNARLAQECERQAAVARQLKPSRARLPTRRAEPTTQTQDRFRDEPAARAPQQQQQADRMQEQLQKLVGMHTELMSAHTST